MKVLHLPESVGGNSWGLVQGEKALGINSICLYTSANWFQYPSDINLRLDKISNNYFKVLKLFKLFTGIRNNYDVFHFNFGRSLLNFPNYGIFQLDLPFYPKSSKLFVTYNGCDARQKFATIRRNDISACHDPECYNGMCNSGKLDRLKKKSIRKMANYVRHMWALNPDLLHFLPMEKSSFLPYSVPQDNIERCTPDLSKRKLFIIHAPTDRACKGSRYIFDAINSLKKSHNHLFDFVSVENIPHKTALNLYQKADIVIDQLLVGWYGAFAIEVMSMGKPTICKITEENLPFIPKQMAHDVKNAFIKADPSNIKDVLLKCIEDREFLRQKSEAALEYARTWHYPKYVASITKQAYESL